MNSTVKCVAIDDEPLALDVIAKFCRRADDMELKVFTDAAEGLKFIKETHPHIAFLDIEMDNVNGLAIASALPEDTCVIFTTAYLHYAIDGFNLDAVDYLHKPFSYERFLTAVGKARRRIGIPKPSLPRAASIIVKQDYSNVAIPLDDIIYVEAIERYCRICRATDVCTVSRVLLKNMEEMLPEADFIRIHRSFIVAINKIKSFSRQEVRLTDGTSIPVGRQYAARMIERLAHGSSSAI